MHFIKYILYTVPTPTVDPENGTDVLQNVYNYLLGDTELHNGIL